MSEAASHFFQTLAQAWCHAAQVCPPTSYFYQVGEFVIELHIVGAQLAARLTPALGHLACPTPQPPALTIALWDVAATDVALPPVPWQPTAYGARSEVQGYTDGRILAAYQMDTGGLSLLDRQQQLAIYAVQNAAQLPSYEDAMPLRSILHWWLRDQGCQLIHAAAIGHEDSGILLAGRGGAGKSTTALAGLLAGMAYVADDYCLVRTTPTPRVYSLYSTGKVAADHIQRFPALRPFVNNPDRLAMGEKALLLLHHHFPEQIKRSFPLRAILLPRVYGGSETQVTRATATDALRALAPSTIFQLPGAGKEDFEFLARFVRHLPCYWLHLGTTIEHIPGVIQKMLGQRHKLSAQEISYG